VGAAPLLFVVAPLIKSVPLAVVWMLQLWAERSKLLQMWENSKKKAQRRRPRWLRPGTSHRPWRWSYARR